MPNRIDLHVGEKLSQRRELYGMGRDRVAVWLGVDEAQVERYENGTDRIGSDHLLKLSKLLNVKVRYFYDGLGAPPAR